MHHGSFWWEWNKECIHMGRTGLKFESWNVKNHTRNVSQHHSEVRAVEQFLKTESRLFLFYFFKVLLSGWQWPTDQEKMAAQDIGSILSNSQKAGHWVNSVRQSCIKYTSIISHQKISTLTVALTIPEQNQEQWRTKMALERKGKIFALLMLGVNTK